MCKPNVKGRDCAICEDGYQNSANNDIPCVKKSFVVPDYTKPGKPDKDRNSFPEWMKKDDDNSGMQADQTRTCLSTENKVLTFGVYCKYEIAIRVTMTTYTERTSDRKHQMYKLKVAQHLYGTSGGRLPNEILVSVPAELVPHCITFEPNTDYFILANNWKRHIKASATVYSLTSTDTILKAKESLQRKVKKFRSRQLDRKCDRI